MRHATGLAAALVLFLAACGTSPEGTRSVPANRNVLTAEEIGNVTHADAFALITALRPNWLRTRGSVSITQGGPSVKVYIDGSLMGGPDQLRQITSRSISTIRYMDGIEATQRWGLDHGLGAIMVSTLR